MTKQPRILMVINHAGFFLTHRLPVALGARDAGYDVQIATPASRHVPRIVETGLPWHPLRLSRSSRNPIGELITLIDLIRLYRRVRPDLVHHVSTKPVLYGTLAARIARVPGVVNAISGLGHAFVEGGRARRLLRTLISLGYRFLVRHPNLRVIFQNVEHQSEFIEGRLVERSATVLIAGSGADTDLFNVAGRQPAGIPNVLFAGRMLFAKGVAQFVEAARELRRREVRAVFTLVGEPDPANPDSVPLEMLQSWAAEGIVRYLGRIDDMPPQFAAADVCVLPTYYSEGVPKVLIEAAASGVPIVTTDWPGCRDIVVDGLNGILVPVKDSIRLADAIQRLVEDPALRKVMGEAGRRRAVERFSLRSVISETLALYAEVLQTAAARRDGR